MLPIKTLGYNLFLAFLTSSHSLPDGSITAAFPWHPACMCVSVFIFSFLRQHSFWNRVLSFVFANHTCSSPVPHRSTFWVHGRMDVSFGRDRVQPITIVFSNFNSPPHALLLFFCSVTPNHAWVIWTAFVLRLVLGLHGHRIGKTPQNLAMLVKKKKDQPAKKSGRQEDEWVRQRMARTDFQAL